MTLAEHGGIALEQLQPRLAWPLPHAGSDDDKAASFQVCVIAGADFQRMSERHSVQDVRGLGDSAARIHIDQDDFPSNPSHHQGVSSRGADHTCSDDSDFHDPRSNAMPSPTIALFGVRR